MNILKVKAVYCALFRIKANRNPLYHTDIIHCTFLFKISQRDMSGCLVNRNRRDRRWYLLNQCQTVFLIFFIRSVN